MRYLLVVGFACEVYRKEPLARIFLGDKLIDEFFIQHHIDTLATAKKKFFIPDIQMLHPNSRDEFTNIRIKNLPPLRFYVIDIGTTLDRTELHIEIENFDSNNTNGFISKSTLIKLQVCVLFPLHQKLLVRLSEIKHKNCVTKNYAWYYVSENFIFDLNRHLHWQGKNGQMYKTIAEHQIGGDGVFKCELVKKYQILMNKTKKPYRHNFNNVFVDYLINKYAGYADQRNID